MRDTVLEAAAERKRARTTEQLGAGVAAFDTVLGNIGRAFTPDRLELNDLAKDDSLPELRDAARELKNTATERTAKRQADALERIEQNTRNGGLRGVGG